MVQEIFEEEHSVMLRGGIIWTPMLPMDNLEAAKGCESRFSDPRVGHYWDPDLVLGRLLSRTLALNAPIAWDVYLVYPPNHAWNAELPPPPEIWMHQLDEEPALYLDSLLLKRKLKELIEKEQHE